jgi:long-chain acyl-CoA synthetase
MKLSRFMYRTALLAGMLVATAAHAVDVAGIKVDDKVRVGGQELILNGAGLRTKFVFKVYVGALYTAEKMTAPAVIYDSPAPRRMLMRMMRDMDAESLYKALDEGLHSNLTETELAGLKPQINQLGTLMKGIGAVKEGDSIAIDFDSAGIEVGVNGRGQGRVEGAPFGRALLKVWLGDRPADAELKKGLLGGQ